MVYVTIVIPVYNAEKYLGECIDSVLAQSFGDFELILVDDGSKDSSGEICDEYAKKDERIRVIHQSNGGVTSARKSGVEAALAEWIMFVDADDKVPAEGLQHLVQVQRQDPQLDTIEGSYVRFYPDGTTKKCQNDATYSGKPVFFDGLEYALSLCREYGVARGPWSKLIRKSLLQDSNALDIPRSITNREDIMMLTSVAKHLRKVVLIPAVAYEYRNQFGISAISNKLSLNYWSYYLYFFNTCVMKDVHSDWSEVWKINVKDVFSSIVHGGYIKNGILPYFFEEKILPELKSQERHLTMVERLYVNVLRFPVVLRVPICFVLFYLWKSKKCLLGNYYLKKSRKSSTN